MFDSDYGIVNEKYLKVYPAVIKANQESVITISSIDANFKFYDDIEYEVKVIPKDESDVPDEELRMLGFEKNRKLYKIKPQSGKLKVKYFFQGEQEWIIHISTKEYKKYQNPMYEPANWPWLSAYPENGLKISVYSLSSDLYGKVPVKGDLHVHTSISDGHESPELTIAAYRSAGFDYLAITDHYIYNDVEQLNGYFDFVKGIKILPGEEVHNSYGGLFHMVNIGSEYSVNDIYLNHPEIIEKEVVLAAEKYIIPDNVDKKEYLHRVVLYNLIKKSGGLAIFPHPCWQLPERFNSQIKMSRAVLENNLCDVFELLGGCTPEGNNLQLALYQDFCCQGRKMPIVASSDSHTVFERQYSGFNELYTITFVDKDSGIVNAVKNGQSVAVEALNGERTRIYGEFNLVKYAHFLHRCYFPKHNALCRASGELLMEYIAGDEGMKDLIIGIEEKIAKFRKEFFGW